MLQCSASLSAAYQTAFALLELERGRLRLVDDDDARRLRVDLDDLGVRLNVCSTSTSFNTRHVLLVVLRALSCSCSWKFTIVVSYT